jgi:hypothetical protein
VSIFDGVVAPTITVEFDLAAPIGPKAFDDAEWTVVPTAQVRNIAIRRGKSVENQTVQPGECTIVFDNRSGDFDPMNESSPYWNEFGSPTAFSWLSPRMGVRVTATWNDVDYVLFVGYMEQLTMDWGINPTATLTFTDLLAYLAQQQLEALDPPAEGNGDQVWFRCDRILDYLSAPAIPSSLRGFDTSVDNTMYGTTYGADVLTLLQQAADCEPARLFVDRDGLLRLLRLDGGDDAGLVFSDDPTDSEAIGYDLIVVDPGAKYLVNDAIITRVNGAGTVTGVTREENAASVTLYGSSTKALTLPIATGSVAAATTYANQYATPIDRVQRVGFSATNLGANFPAVLSTDLADYITVTRTTYDDRTVTFSCTVEGIEHDITPESWRVALLPGTNTANSYSGWMGYLTGEPTLAVGLASVQHDPEGDVYIAGMGDNGSFALCAYLARVSDTGVILWQRGLTDDANACTFYDVHLADGVLYTVGKAGAVGIVAAWDTDGTLLWQTEVSDIRVEFAGVTSDASGNTIAVGNILDTNPGTTRGYLAKFDDTGAVVWQRKLTPASGGSLFYQVAIDSTGDIIAVGEGPSNTLLVKYDSSGSIVWQKDITGAYAYAIAMDEEDNIYLAGATTGLDGWLAKLDNDGAFLWQRETALAVGYLAFFSVALDGVGGVVAAGYADVDLLLVKYDTSGVLEYQRTITSDAGSMLATGVSATEDRIYLVADAGDGFVMVAPAAGTAVGTYELEGVDYTYAEATISESATTLTVGTSTLTGSTPTQTVATGDLFDDPAENILDVIYI